MMTDDRRLTGSKKNREVRGERRIALAKLVCIACTSVRIVRTVIFVVRTEETRSCTTARLLVCLCYNIISKVRTCCYCTSRDHNQSRSCTVFICNRSKKARLCTPYVRKVESALMPILSPGNLALAKQCKMMRVQ